MKLITICLFFCLITGCSHTLSKKECSNNKLFNIGKKLAYKGVESSVFQSLQNSCKEYGIKIEEQNFTKGWKKGMEDFCTEQRGFHWGYTRKDDPKICPQELKALFKRGYNRGIEASKG